MVQGVGEGARLQGLPPLLLRLLLVLVAVHDPLMQLLLLQLRLHPLHPRLRQRLLASSFPRLLFAPLRRLLRASHLQQQRMRRLISRGPSDMQRRMRNMTRVPTTQAQGRRAPLQRRVQHQQEWGGQGGV